MCKYYRFRCKHATHKGTSLILGKNSKPIYVLVLDSTVNCYTCKAITRNAIVLALLTD